MNRPVTVDAALFHRLAVVILDLEHPYMTRDVDARYQAAAGDLAQLVDDDTLWSLLQRAALACHHCHDIDHLLDDMPPATTKPPA